MKDLYIKDIKIGIPVILAPMAGITNFAYRKLMKEYSCPLVVTEMVSDFALHYGNKETINMLKTDENEHPLSVQLFGGSKDSLLKGTKVLMDLGGFEILDINLGCPVNKVVKEGSGSAWLKIERQEELYQAIKEVVETSKVPVTCKIRLGWDEEHINVVETCKLLEKAGVSLIAIHARTRSMMYSGTPKYEYIKLAKEAVNIPIIANGDINSLDDALKVLELTNADGVMIGRGSLGNPNLIKQIVTYFEKGERIPDSTLLERVEELKKHFTYLKELKGEFKTVAELRGLSSHYLKGFSDTKRYRVKFTTMNSEKEFLQICNEIVKNYQENLLINY